MIINNITQSDQSDLSDLSDLSDGAVALRFF